MVRRRELIGLVAVLALLWGVAVSGARAGEVTVFAAASLKDAMDQIAQGYEASQGQRVVVSLAGSSALARQIEYGAPADVFLSANVQWMDYLENKGLIETASRIDLLGNQLVLVAPKGRAASESTVDGAATRALLGDGRLAMALVDAVPAGQYGKAALEALGIWDALRDRVAQVDNVRAALALDNVTNSTPLNYTICGMLDGGGFYHGWSAANVAANAKSLPNLVGRFTRIVREILQAKFKSKTPIHLDWCEDAQREAWIQRCDAYDRDALEKARDLCGV